MSALRSPRSRRAVRLTVAIATGVALIATVWGPAAQAAPARPASSADDPAWTAPKEKSVPVREVKPVPKRPDPAEARAITSSPTVKWPAAGTAEVAVPAGPNWTSVLTAGRVAAPKARAGDLPVSVGRPSSSATRAPDAVRVELARQDAGLLLKVGAKQSGRVSLQVDYQGFRHAFGGDWANRLRLFRLPACALTRPGTPDCAGVAVPTVNDGSGTLSADVPVGPATELFAVQAGPSGSTGNFGASALAPSATWQAGTPSGDFGWNYPMAAPPSTGGPAPQVSLDYSSGGVDGRTSSTNNQPSWVGQGFDLQPGGSIERRYASCASKSEASGNQGSRVVGDLCFAGENATLTLSGKGGELVRDDTTGAWRPRTDDGSRIERLFGTVNDDDGRVAAEKGEYWKLTTKDGTQYYFGLNKLPGATTQRTNSAWTVPAFGNHAGEQCYAAGNFAGSWCQQAYKWNLDYVVDRHGNTMSLFYDVETNYYGRNSTATTVSQYTRAGNIARIEYGQRDGQVFSTKPVGQVHFQTAPRCIPGSACSARADFPDVPTDQECTSSTNCPNKFNPTFWTKKRLAKVTTEIWRGSAFETVSSWTLRHSFPDNGDGTQPGLWLEAVTHAGHVGNAPGVMIPEVNFDGQQLANRIDVHGDGYPPMKWWRVNAIQYGTGGQLAITYSGADCAPGNLPAPDTNTRRCHPMKWTPPGATSERTDWFHKYVVTKVLEHDLASGQEPVTTTIEYPGPAAWRHDDEDGLVEIGQKTWAQWRGYDLVRVIKGADPAEQIVTESRYYRGMDGDKRAAGGVKDVKITDSTGVQVDDLAPLSGQLREQRTLSGSQLVDRTISDQWVSQPTATRTRSWGVTNAFQIEQAGNKQAETIEGGLRQSAANNNYDTNGLLLSSNDLNDLSTAADDVCTRFEYTKNDTLAIAEMPKREVAVALSCDKPFTKDDVISDTRTYYDYATDVNTAPTKGDVTRTERLKEFNSAGAPVYQTVQTVRYDDLGRSIEMTDALNNKSTTAYTPAAGGPVTKTVVTKPNNQTTTIELEPAWGEETGIVDETGKRTEASYDPLGRTDKVWMPGNSGATVPAGNPSAKAGGNVAGLAATMDNAAVPDVDYDYAIYSGEPNVVTTKTRQTDDSIETVYQISDGLMRPRQTQEAAPNGGRVIHDVTYDSRGLEVIEDGPYHNDGAPVADYVDPVSDAEMPTRKVTQYDLAGRPSAEVFRSMDQPQWETRHSYAGDRHAVDPPEGDEPTTRITDVQGRLTELRQHTGASPATGYDKTSYTYTKAGQLKSVTDPAGNVWSFEYDLRGRKIKETDPDRGITTYTYNDLDQLATQTDARGVTLAYAYDAVGRKTAVHEGSLQGRKRSEWTYDRLRDGTPVPGMPASSTRFDTDGDAYIAEVTGYDNAGRATGNKLTVPASEGALAGTYSFGSTYKADGQLATETLPGVGGLPGETLTYGYDTKDLPKTLKSGTTDLVRNTAYTPYGEVETVDLGTTGGKFVKLNYEYEVGNRRLSKVTTEKETSPRRVSEVAYSYDDSGNVEKITDTPNSVTGEPTDTQCFDYDYLRRMTGAWTPANGDCETTPTAAGLGGPAPYWHSWTFDKTGNRKTETKTWSAGSTTATYNYPATGAAQPHAVQSVVTTGTGMPAGGRTDGYSYNQTGDLKTRTTAGVGETFSWNADGDLEKVTKAGQETSYLYDANGERLIRRDASGTTLYLDDTELLLKPGASTAEGTRYYQHGDQTVAVRTGGKLTWLGADHHATSTTAIEDTATQNVQRRRLDPYGSTRGTAPTAWPGQRGFVGGTNDPTTGLVHLGAREYDPTLGKFISVDPLADFEDPQTLNGYAYANNNPMTFSDPDGTSWFSSIVSSIKNVAETVVKRTVETVKHAVKVVAPVVNWVRDKASNAVEAVKSFVHKTVQVVKKVVKTVKTVVKKAIKVVKKVVKKVAQVAKKAVAKVKAAVKQVAKAVRAVAHKVAAVAQKAAKWVYEHRNQILAVVAEIAITVAVGALTGGVGALAVRGLMYTAKFAAGAKRLKTAADAGKAMTKYDADFAMGQVAKGGKATASQMEKFGKAQGWTRSQTANGPAKFTDDAGVVRLTVKRGTGRAPGSRDPHVEMRNAGGQRMDAYGNEVTRKSPGNHTPIQWDLP